jgi:hypothetical protein
MTQFEVGSISTGTLNPEDLLPTFARELERHAPDHALVTAANDILDRLPDEWDGGGASELINDIQDELQTHCPPFVTFGSHPGDGADFGYWPDMERIQKTLTEATMGHTLTLPRNGEWEWTLEDDGVIVNTNDHGNVTVMDLNRNVLWAVV